MSFVETPLTDGMVTAVGTQWEVPTTAEPQRLHGGEESAAYRLGSVVVRVGPAWRTSEELEWCHDVATTAAGTVVEAVAPLPTRAGATVVVIEGRPVSVWPFVEGEWLDDEDDDQWDQAVQLLARLHRALAAASGRIPPRPGTPASAPQPLVAAVADDDLDRWLRAFDAPRDRVQPLHGDFYAGNILVRGGRVAGLVDWDEALLGPPERELAWAAWEFGDGLWSEGLDGTHEFMAAYRAAGGPARRVDDTTLRQLVRQRLRGEIEYAARLAGRGVVPDDDDLEYRDRQTEMFRRLRP